MLTLRYRFDDLDWQNLLDRLAQLKYRAAFVGPKGTGKTTLLEDLELRLEAQGWRIAPVRLSRERRQPSAQEWRGLRHAGPRHLVTVDGVEQLGGWQWHRLSRRCRGAGGLVVTSHRVGRLPTLREHRTDPRLLHQLVVELVGPTRASRLQPRLDQLFVRHQGNLRDCLRSLYDAWARGDDGWIDTVRPHTRPDATQASIARADLSLADLALADLAWPGAASPKGWG